MNRKPSILYIHNTLCRNVSQNGHDSRRPRIGVAIHYTTEKGKERLKKDPPPTTTRPIFKKARSVKNLTTAFPVIVGREPSP